MLDKIYDFWYNTLNVYLIAAIESDKAHAARCVLKERLAQTRRDIHTMYVLIKHSYIQRKQPKLLPIYIIYK